MLSYEYKVYYYVTQHGNSVYYRVTPYYHDDKPQCYGVLIEAVGIEEPDWGFTVFVYNISEEELNNSSKEDNNAVSLSTSESTSTYILNINTGVFHKPSCASVKRMKESNKEIVEDTRENVINRGYRPCEKCHP
jgi:DNA-entry nuclease